MGFDLTKTNRHSLIAYALTTFQLAALIAIATILISAVGAVSLATAVSTAIMFLLGLPMLVLLYMSTADRDLKTAFLGLTANIAFLSASGVAWYLLSGILRFDWLIPLAKVLMLAAYAPLIYCVFLIYRGEWKKLNHEVRVFINCLNFFCAAIFVILAMIGLSAGKPLDIVVYGISSLCDLALLTMTAQLAIARQEMRYRYVFTVIFIFMLLSLGGDSLNFIDSLVRGPGIFVALSGIFYNIMLIFLAAALLVYSFFKDDGAAAVAEVNKKLGDTRHAMDDLISQMPDAACIFDPAGKVLQVNDQFLRLFDRSRQDMAMQFNLFDHVNSLPCEVRNDVEGLREGKTIFIDRKKLFLPGGQEAYVSFKLFPTYAQDGRISGYIAICEDVTSRVKDEEELKQAKALVELYIDLMGHDINNMNQVGMGYLEIALDTMETDDNQRKLLLKPLEAMANSSKLIDNVKKLRRANEMSLRPVDLGRVLKEVIAEHSEAPQRDISIRYNVVDDTMVRANELLKDVFANLVSNAIKHSEGAVSIEVRSEPATVDGLKYHRVVVEDNGPGIPDSLKPMVFDRLLRGRSKAGGSGIGLYLVKSLVDSFGGTISVEDRVPGDRKQGTRFIVMLPAA